MQRDWYSWTSTHHLFCETLNIHLRVIGLAPILTLYLDFLQKTTTLKRSNILFTSYFTLNTRNRKDTFITHSEKKSHILTLTQQREPINYVLRITNQQRSNLPTRKRNDPPFLFSSCNNLFYIVQILFSTIYHFRGISCFLS